MESDAISSFPAFKSSVAWRRQYLNLNGFWGLDCGCVLLYICSLAPPSSVSTLCVPDV